ncbi:mycofactocin biosynthesis glycosyltransferase MftF [Haloterrigena turkmenica]|nr:mycofactocin biosynthesis glycosyltransferase MftF [Haloterrigena turkmenica]
MQVTIDSSLDDSNDATGRYRLWDGVSCRGSVLFSRRPLTVTRLNDTGATAVAALDIDAFRSPAAVAAEIDTDPDAVARLFERLHRRGFLEWAPSRDESYAPPVSVVVTVRDARDHLVGCLDALEALEYPEYEVVVVDDGSTDGTVEEARAHELADRGRLRVVPVGSAANPLGIGASRNRGVDAASHDIIAFTDADCRPRPDWLSALVPALAAHDVVGGRVRPRGDGPVDAYEGQNSSLDMGAYAARVDPDGATPYLPTANLLARREVLERVPFPERSVAEDVDVCWRAVDRGYDVVYSPDGVVEHDYRADLRSFAARRSDYGASEALLARTYRRGDSVPIGIGPLVVGIVLLALAVGLVTLPTAPLALRAIGALLAVGVAVGPLRRYRRLRRIVDPGTVLRSRARGLLSGTYAVATEVTRYYALPLGTVAFAALLVGRSTLAVTIAAGVALAVAFPAAVEYAVERPPLSPTAYARFYAADHFGYQRGVYRGAVAHRTLAHLSPARRFRLAGPGAGVLTTAADAVAAPIRARTNGEASVRTVSIDGVAARFRLDTSTESWWLEDETLRGERPVLADLLKRLGPDDAVLDVGANVGLYACFAGRILSDGRVVAVEPHPGNADRLAENLGLNGVDASVTRAALGATDGSGRLDVPADRVGAGTSVLAADSADSSAQSTDADRVPVDVAAGDSLLERTDVPSPTVVKIDVEGAEIEVLRGLDETLSASDCRLVYCEIHPAAIGAFDATADDVEGFLRERGFALERVQEWDDRYLVRAIRRSDDGEPN